MQLAIEQQNYIALIVERLHASSTADELFPEFGRIVTELGFDRYTLGIVPYGQKPDVAPIFSTTIDDEFTQLYAARDAHLYDPYIREVASGLLPISHRRIMPIFRNHSVLRDIYEVGLDHEVVNGITFPLSTLGVSRGFSFWSKGADNDFDATVERHGSMLQAIAAHCAVTAEMLGVAPDTADDVQLTSRERDCLCLLGLGHTNLQIAEILGVSERTVRFHLTNACEKLGVTSRTHAVSRALQLNLIAF